MEGVIGKKSRWVLDGKRGKFYLRMQLFPSGWKKNTPLNKSPHFCFVLIAMHVWWQTNLTTVLGALEAHVK